MTSIRADTVEENGAILQPRLDFTQWCVSKTGKQMNKSGEIKSVPWSWLKQQQYESELCLSGSPSLETRVGWRL